MSDIALVDRMRTGIERFDSNKNMTIFNSMLWDRVKDRVDYDVYLPSIGKNLQRDFVWTLYQKQQFILSILKGINIPDIAVIEEFQQSINTNTTIQIIDGKQRISTFFSFVNNEFPVVIFDSEYLYNELDPKTKNMIDRFRFVGTVYYSDKGDSRYFIQDKIKIKWFELLNFSGTPQDETHVNELKKAIN